MSSDNESFASPSFVQIVTEQPNNNGTSDITSEDNVDSRTTSNSSTILTNNTSSVSKILSNYSSIMISDDLWQHHFQDNGCTLSNLHKKVYNRMKIPPVGPPESPMYYYNISSIAIDYLKKFSTEKELGNGWNKVPVNMTNAKDKIIGLLLSLRRQDNGGVYVLEQERIIGMLANI